MTSPFSGVVVPSAAGRCEVQGIGPQSYPVEWFTRSNFGGRFSSQLKYAGWDGIAIEGTISAADDPVWINIINDKVTIENAPSLWGLDTVETQEEMWRRVTSGLRFGEWLALGANYTTQKPAVLCIGPSGERQARIAALIHDAGTGAVKVANPKALIDTRLW
jgi:aldehyde:ferredoxin oxidoreductase